MAQDDSFTAKAFFYYALKKVNPAFSKACKNSSRKIGGVNIGLLIVQRTNRRFLRRLLGSRSAHIIGVKNSA